MSVFIVLFNGGWSNHSLKCRLTSLFRLWKHRNFPPNFLQILSRRVLHVIDFCAFRFVFAVFCSCLFSTNYEFFCGWKWIKDLNKFSSRFCASESHQLCRFEFYEPPCGFHFLLASVMWVFLRHYQHWSRNANSKVGQTQKKGFTLFWVIKR